MSVINGASDRLKIDSAATLGLAGMHNSLAYRVHEIEQHFHSPERWYGSDGDGTGSTANNLTPWQIQASATPGAWGTEIQILGANDVSASDFGFTPVYFDLHRIYMVDSNDTDETYIVQFWCGDTTFGAADFCTEIPYRTGSSTTEVAHIGMQMSRSEVTKKFWARCKCTAASTTLDFIVGIHAYPG